VARDHTPDLGLDGRARFDPPELLALNYPLGDAHAPCLCSLLARTEAVRRAGGFEESFTGFYEDQAFLSKMYLAERIGVMDACHDRYRIHERSCSAVVRREGQYDRYRREYLHWLAGYLERSGGAPAAVASRLAAALEPYREPTPGAAAVEWLRLLRVAEGNAAHLELFADAPEHVRVAITRVVSAVPYDVQLNLPRLRANAGERYLLSFRARADAVRKMGVGFADGRTPWQNLGLYDVLDLDTEWREYGREFTAVRDQKNARVHFDLGEHDASVELSGLSLRCVTDGTLVRPDIAGNRPGGSSPHRPVPVGEVDLGDLRRLTPLSPDFGCDRGRPVDRYYILRFLAARAADVRGRVLEVGERTYTRDFGGDRVTSSDVLHVSEGEPDATVIADLSRADHIPSYAFDCIIITQTLQLIYDVAAAVRTMHRILEPGGVVLATVPGISQTYDSEWGGSWYWNFTPLSARRLFEETFGAGNVEVEAHGNVLAAISFLHGLAEEELTSDELDHRDSGYPLTITVRAVKRATAGNAVALAGDEAAGKTVAATGEPDAPAAEGVARPGGVAHVRHGLPLVLMYHRVSTGHVDPFSLCVSPERFQEQLEVLTSEAHPMTLGELLAAAERGDAPENALAVTFDDGYADNLQVAAPLLAAHSIPATFFVTGGPWAAERELWWDELEGLLLGAGELPSVITATIGARGHRWSLEDTGLDAEARAAALRSWRVEDAPPGPREALFLELWRLLQPLPSARQEAVLDELRASLGRPAGVRATHRRLSPAEIGVLGAQPGLEIGAHTATHPVLPAHARADQLWELATNKRALESIVGGPVTRFAYPYGSHSDETVALVREVGFESACSTEPRPVARGEDPLRIPRVAVLDWRGEDLARRLHHWRRPGPDQPAGR
jgi:peptidoglycan/xylan/chitin deacetylase (PgdA/CDA1 family)/SAM-dependent methyltransferase